jgi:hypothetical protein
MDISNTRYLRDSIRNADNGSVIADLDGTVKVTVERKKLNLNGHYTVDLTLTRADILTLARMAFEGQDFLEIVRELGKKEQAPVYGQAVA